MIEAWARRRADVVRHLTELANTAEVLGATTLARRVREELVEKLEADRFHLVVVGEFNHGKSTLVNALLGFRVLPVGVTPTTAAIHLVIHAETPWAAIVSDTGQRTELGIETLGSLSSEGGARPDGLARVEVGYPARFLEGRLVLVDTPGVNDLSSVRAEITYGYIPRADAILFVLDAGQPVKESERRFLLERIMGKSRDKVLFVVCKADLWPPGERQAALDYVRRQLGEVVADPKIFLVNAEGALRGEPESGLEALSEGVTGFVAEHRGNLVLANALAEGRRVAAALAHGIEARKEASTLDAAALDARIDRLASELDVKDGQVEAWRRRIREQAALVKAHARTKLDAFVDDLVRRLPALVEPVAMEDVQQHLGAFLEHALQKWADAASEEIAAALENLAEETEALIRDDRGAMLGAVQQAIGARRNDGRVKVDTFPYDVGVFAVFSLGLGMLFANAMLGGILMAAAPVLAVWSRDKARIAVRRRAVELGGATLREAAVAIAAAIDEGVDRYAERLDQWVVARSRELHEQLVEVLGRVRAARQSTADGTENDTAFREAEERLSAIDGELRSMLHTIEGHV